MTAQEAITELETIKRVYANMRKEYKPCVEALQMAINLLKQADTPQTDCNGCEHWKYIAHEWQCETIKCQGFRPRQTDCGWK